LINSSVIFFPLSSNIIITKSDDVCIDNVAVSNTFIVTDLGGSEVTTRFHSESEVTLGSEIDFHFNLSKASIFDPKTGNRLN
jgi:hypothetical protein